MNKPLKHKSSTRNIKTNKSSKIKESSTFTSRTPLQKNRGVQLKKNQLHKFKSIPVISYQEGEQSNLPSQKGIHMSYTGNQTKRVVPFSAETEPQLINSISERNHSGSKVSLHSKLNNAEKQTIGSSKNKTNCTLKTQYLQNQDLNDIYRRTKNVFEQFRKKEESWKKQKAVLVKELQRYKNKSHSRKNSSAYCLKNVKSP